MKAIPLIVIMSCLILSGCAGWTINGIPCDRFKNADAGEYAQLVGGIATSFTVHWLGHITYYELNGIDWSQEGLSEVAHEPVPDKLTFSRAGFVGQLLIGTVLKLTPWNDTFFVTGYHAGTCIEVMGYPITVRDGDYTGIDENGGSAYLEYGIYSTWSLLLLQPGAPEATQSEISG